MITQREVEENGIVYIITEDDENPDFFIQEPKDKGEPEPEQPTPEQIRITQLETENILLKERASQIQDDNNFIFEILINAGLLD